MAAAHRHSCPCKLLVTCWHIAATRWQYKLAGSRPRVLVMFMTPNPDLAPKPNTKLLLWTLLD